MTVRGDVGVDRPEDQPPAEPPARRTSRRRFWLRRIAVLVAIVLLWLTWSVGGALTAPGTDTTAARLAEWGRFHGLGWAVTYLEEVQYKADPPKVGGNLAGGIPRIAPNRPPTKAPNRPAAKAPPKPPNSLALPATIPSQAHPALSDEGTWQSLLSLHGQPAIQAAFLRPDSQHTSYLVGVAWLNQKLVKTTLHPGYKVPGNSGLSQVSEVPRSQRDTLLATFNSGFTMVDSNGGYWQDGTSVVALRPGAASMVFYKDGRLDVARWDGGTPGPDVAAVRQNLDLLVDKGVINPSVDSTTTAVWGVTLGNKTYVWRSAVGVRKDGSLVFVVGASMSVRTLANIAHDAGAERAMELDINPAWTNFMTYTHPSKGVAVPHMLSKDTQPNPYRYLQPSSRDFVAVFPR